MDPKSHVITDFIHTAKSGKIQMMTDGSEERQFLHTDDCSKALLAWCLNYQNIDRNEYIDITSYEWTSIIDIAKIISNKIPCEIVPGTKKDSIQLGIKNTPSTYFTKFWKPEISISEGISKLIGK
jgi:nucleoside-diphosphate-sugar epimerase